MVIPLYSPSCMLKVVAIPLLQHWDMEKWTFCWRVNSEVTKIADSFMYHGGTQKEIGVLYGCAENESLNGSRYKMYLSMISSESSKRLPEQLPPT